ncbi:MAG TPA: hypothetical protein VJ576_20445 [Rhodocyclaceae bacterium]|nr:hypothetical protein [Rhodocyclaceae bacterium]
MPLTEVILLLNASPCTRGEGLGTEFRFVAAAGRVFASYGDLRLESSFVPLLDFRSGEVRGHEGVLAAARSGCPGAVAAGEVYARPASGAGIVRLDRLVRTLHALNYLLQPQRGMLLVGVHPGTAGASDWGFACDGILAPCRLLPERLVLEVGGVGYHRRALRACRSRGYGLAVSLADRGRLRELRPDLVKVPYPGAGGEPPPHHLVGSPRDLGIRNTATGGTRRSAGSWPTPANWPIPFCPCRC